MRLTLEIQTGPDAGRWIDVRPGQVVRLGRYAPGNTVVLHDPLISTTHLAVECDEHGCRLRDLGSRWGTQVNQVSVTEAVLQDGDLIQAGDTRFAVRLTVGDAAEPWPSFVLRRAKTMPAHQAGPTPTAVSGPTVATPPAASLQDRMLKMLREQPEPLYAILDAARDPLILTLLRTQCPEPYQSLYEGLEGEQLAAAAPYLVRLPPQSPFLETLVRLGWGKSWGVFLTCHEPFAEVRQHLRRFLIVETAEGQRLYFRFYDPRVLRVFLPSCQPEERKAFLGQATCYLLEDDQGSGLLRFAAE